MKDKLLEAIATQVPFTTQQLSAIYDQCQSFDTVIAVCDYAREKGLADLQEAYGKPAPTQNPIIIGKSRRDMKPITKPSFILVAISWAVVFTLGIVMATGLIAASSTNKFLFLVFLLIAVMASAVYSGKPRIKTNDIRIKIGGDIFTGDSLTVHELKDGSVFVYVDLSRPVKVEKGKK